jgi:hypothetical protein
MPSNRKRTAQAIVEARRLQARARTQLAAGISAAMAATDAQLRRFVDTINADQAPHVDVDDDLIRATAVAIGEAVHEQIERTVGVTIADPRLLPSLGMSADVAGHVVIDVDHALLLKELRVAAIDLGDNDPGTVLTALVMRGRVNHSPDHAQITIAADIEGVAMVITHLYALAARGGWSAALDAAVDQQVAGLPQTPTDEGTSEQT